MLPPHAISISRQTKSLAMPDALTENLSRAAIYHKA
jgi:hypothetical protein